MGRAGMVVLLVLTSPDALSEPLGAGARPVHSIRDISLACNDLSLSGAKQTLASGLQGEFMSSRPKHVADIVIPPGIHWQLPPSSRWKHNQIIRSMRSGEHGCNCVPGRPAGLFSPFYNDPAKRALMKPEAVFEVESGLKLSAFDITAASAVRSDWYQAMR
jgi:hypothetical protein